VRALDGMFFIPGFLISIATFPGIMVHELAHLVCCHLTGTKVHEVCYFQVDNPAGYVIHERPTNVWKHILIGVGPFLFNTLVGLICGVIAWRMHLDPDHVGVMGGIFLWLAISIAMHAFPSTGDARSIWQAIWGEGAPLAARLFGTPLVAIIFLGAIGSFFWLDLVYGLGVVLALPKMILG